MKLKSSYQFWKCKSLIILWTIHLSTIDGKNLAISYIFFSFFFFLEDTMTHACGAANAGAGILT